MSSTFGTGERTNPSAATHAVRTPSKAMVRGVIALVAGWVDEVTPRR
jgi:hypothetical protein